MGLLPSANSAVKNSQRNIPWGTPAGAVRASSGYAFSRIQRASESMAQHWSQHHFPSPAITHESKLLAWMDRVFLPTLWSASLSPNRAPPIFSG
jgi:hypothetical protein